MKKKQLALLLMVVPCDEVLLLSNALKSSYDEWTEDSNRVSMCVKVPKKLFTCFLQLSISKLR